MDSATEFGDLCRICCAKTNVLMGLNIFEKEGNMRQIYKKITECLPIQVHSYDKLPKMVCEECAYKLDLVYEFREKSIKTEYELNNMLKRLEEEYQTAMGDQLTITSLPVQDTVLADAILVQCVNPSLEGHPPSDPLVMKSMNKRGSENLKCEPDVNQFIKIEGVQGAKNGERVVAANTAVESDSDSEDSDSGSDSDGSSLPDADLHDTGTMIEAVCTDNGVIQNNVIGAKIVHLTESDEYVLPNTDQGTSINQSTSWFFCNVCAKAFAKQEDFQAHYQYHWNKCFTCGAVFTTVEALADHKKTSHSKKSKSNVVDTVQENEEKDTSKKKPEIKKDSKPGEMKSCTECGKEYRTNYKLLEHMRKHTGEKPFKCSTCDKAFRSKIGLNQHEAKHTGIYDYTCNSCGKGFQSKSYLIVHQRVHSDLKPYSCTTCGHNFKTKQSLQDHQNRHLGVKPYVCEICGRGFITKGLCKSHQRVHSGADNRQYPCSVCQKLFVSKSYLATHLRIHTGEKPFMCEVCGKGFLTRVDLRIHSTMHTGEKSFICEVCGKAFARRDALRCHRRSHTGERPYRCDVCGQSFTQFSPMAIHKRLHTGERPYACDVCGKTFVSRSTMMSHRKKHT